MRGEICYTYAYKSVSVCVCVLMIHHIKHWKTFKLCVVSPGRRAFEMYGALCDFKFNLNDVLLFLLIVKRSSCSFY